MNPQSSPEPQTLKDAESCGALPSGADGQPSVSPRPRVDFDRVKIAEFCRKWNVRELALFGSVLRDDFRPDSDVDVLIEFEPDAPWSYWEWPELMGELEAIFHRKVDLIPKGGLRNPFRRKEILTTRQVLYAA